MNVYAKKLIRALAFAAAIACTTSCKDVTHIQTGYISDRGDCRSRAEYGTSTYAGSSNISGKDRSNMLLQLFCECMKERDWNVAGCKFKDTAVAKAAPAPQQPTIVVVQSPPAAAAVAPAPVAAPMAECPLPPKASKSKKRPKRRLDGTCPAPEEYGQTELDQLLNKQ